MKIICLLLALAFSLLTCGNRASAQSNAYSNGDFEWVDFYSGITNYYGATDCNKIVGSDVDSEGNVYVIGEFTYGAEIDDVELLPITPYGSQWSTNNVVIAKLSPAGDLLWRKTIHSNDGQNSSALGIRCLGDTSVVCIAFMSSPGSGNYTYFLDTLLPDYESASFLWAHDSLMRGIPTAWLQFSPDGELQERHLLTISYIDSVGNEIMGDKIFENAPQYANRYDNYPFSVRAFDVDAEGNIILVRSAYDQLHLYCDTCNNHETLFSTANGMISAFNILIDDGKGFRKLRCTIPSPTSIYNSQLLKFSPHFDSLMASSYYFSMPPDDTLVDNIEIHIYHSVKTDLNGNVYVTGSVLPIEGITFGHNFGLELPNSGGLTLDIQESSMYKPFLIEFNSELIPQHIVQLAERNSESKIMSAQFNGMNFDEDGNIIILTLLGKGSAAYQNEGQDFYYGETPLHTESNALGFIRLDSNWNLLSFGMASPGTDSGRLPRQLDFAVGNNRIITQMRYSNVLASVDSVYTTPGYSHGLLTWDYDGHTISFIDFHNTSQQSVMGGTILRDTALYISGMFDGSASLMDLSVPGSGNAHAYITRFVDTAFKTPFVFVDNRKENLISWNQDLNFTLVQNPVTLTAVASSGLPVTYQVDDTTIATLEGNMLILLQEGVCNITASQQGDNFYLPAIPVEKTLVIHQQGIELIDNPVIRVYPNPAQETVTIATTDEPIVDIVLFSSSGQRKTVVRRGNTLSVSELPAGIYYLLIITNNNTNQQKFIKL